ncbi:TM0106 family RecB-like putative nuclease [Phormidesmis sp. 146-12]
MLLTADLLLNYQRCSRRAYLDLYGDLTQRDAPNDYLQKLLQDSIANHREILADQAYHQPTHTARDWSTGANATLELMQRGVDRIYQPVLMSEENGVTLISVPDLLTRQPGESVFGDWVYVPTEIKLSKRPKQEYQIIVAFHVRVLAAVQGAWSETAWLMLREKGLFEVDLWESIPRMELILQECLTTLQQKQEPEVFISRSRCSLCHWYNQCYTIAKSDQHLSLLPGVTPPRYAQLQALNLTSVEALANIQPSQLEPLPGFGSETARKLVRQAQSFVQNCALPGESNADPPESTNGHRFLNGKRAAQEIPTADVELYFDIEAEPSLNLIYLHGILVVDRQKKTEVFHSLLAEKPEDEFKIWQELIDLMWVYPTAPIFHFCPYEVQTMGRLAELYETPIDRIQPLLPRFIDLHDRITKSVTLPVESYALKHIARWLGFDWRDSSANGAQSIYWYAQWLATGDRSFLNSILVYNEDDCRATYHIKEWLVDFLQQQRERSSAIS